MSKCQKLLERLLSKPKDFAWSEAVSLLKLMGFEVIYGKGSRRKFMHKKTKALIILHEPHPNKIMKSYAINEMIDALEGGGFLDE